jgi:hypothetical protein
MISTKNLISRLEDIPKEWVYEFYLQLSEKLTGQSLKIKSAFNSREKTASMYIYVDNKGVYKFKDFSSGHGGDALNLVQILFNLQTRAHASFRIVDDYNEYIKSNKHEPLRELVAHSKFGVSDYEMRHWNNLDQSYWTSFHIGSNLLRRYNIMPLSFYEMTKTDNLGIETSMRIASNYIYGYFKDDGTLYKIYQPKVRDNKFIKVRDYIQGSEQLTGDKKYLVITSSLKDLMAFKKLNISDVECISPDSENSMIPASYMMNAIKHYKKVFILFDNDEPGKKAAIKYHTTYGVPYITLPMEKDLSDSVKLHGVDAARNKLLPLLKQAL